MKFVILMDPPETISINKDTAFAFMECAYQRGHEVYYLPKGGLSLNQGEVVMRAFPTVPQRVEDEPLVLSDEVRLHGDEIDAFFIRPDPPFDTEYLNNTWMLDRLPPNVFVMNKPSGVRTVNEKLWATQFTEIIPRTVVTRNQADYTSFLKDEGQIIAKPTDGYGGSGVFRVRDGDSNANVIFEMLSHQSTTEVILQQYIPESTVGDKRILLLNGDLLGAVLRVHSAEDHRNNFFAGGKPQKTEITAREQEIISTLKPHLLALGLYFVGIDVIGDYLIEVNVTAPTGIQEASRLSNLPLTEKVMEFVEEQVNAISKK